MEHTTIDQEVAQRIDPAELDSLPLAVEQPVVNVQRQNNLRRQIVQALRNPIFLVLITWLVMAFLLVKEVVIGQ